VSEKSPPDLLVQNLTADRAVVAGSVGTVVFQDAPSRWVEVDFSEQDDLRAALSGASMGPRHVDACPMIKEVPDIVEALQSHHAVAIVGESGTGKSMAAWHAAHRMSRVGWSVYLLASAHGADFPPDGHSVLLLVDDVQAYPVPPVSPALANSRRYMLVVSNQPVPGFRRTVRIAAKRAVAGVAEGLLERQDVLLPLLQEFDTHVGERALDLSVERKIVGAREASEALWQFMFNLGSGYLRMRGALEDLLAVPHCARILFAIAARQLATKNLGVPVEWLRQHLTDDEGSLEAVMQEIHARVPLVRTSVSAATPHPLVASRVVKALYYGENSGERVEIFWALFDDESIPLGGLAWLMRESPNHLAVGMGVPDAPKSALPSRLVERCAKSPDVGGAAEALAQLLSWWRVPNSALRPHLTSFTGWLAHPNPDDGYALHRLVNNLYNADKDLARDLVVGVEPATVARWVNGATVSTAAPLGALLGRLLLAAPETWRESLAAHLDREAMLSLAAAFGPDEAWDAAQLIPAVAGVDRDTAMKMARAHIPALVEAMRISVLDAFSAAQDLIWNVLGFAPHFLRGGYEPTPEAHAVARELVEKTGPDAIASQLASARRRDWHPWAGFSGFIREVAPEFASDVAASIPIEDVLRSVVRYAEDERDMDDVLVARTTSLPPEWCGTCWFQGARSHGELRSSRQVPHSTLPGAVGRLVSVSAAACRDGKLSRR